MPVAVVSGGQTWMVHVDHLNRPISMTNASKAAVWNAVWAPWGGKHAITGSAILNARLRSCVPAFGRTPVVPARMFEIVRATSARA